jgi:hypothetical protein
MRAIMVYNTYNFIIYLLRIFHEFSHIPLIPCINKFVQRGFTERAAFKGRIDALKESFLPDVLLP